MKEAVGGSRILVLVLVFLGLFTAFICLSTNISRTYKIKDQVINIIERKKGVNPSSLVEINNYLASVGYRSTGTCSTNSTKWEKCKIVTTNETSLTKYCGSGFEANYCILRHKVDSVSGSGGTITIPKPPTVYYSVEIFFKFSAPVIGDAFRTGVMGETAQITYPDEFATGWS